MPNIKWLPSRSVNRREEHEQFYNRIWPKDDPFWDHNQPGNLWNCKCDWQQTDEPPTDNNPTSRIQHKGLDGNPAKTGQIFSDNASYTKNKSGKEESNVIFLEKKRIQKLKIETKTIQSGIGEISINAEFMEECAKANTNLPSNIYFLKSEIANNIENLIHKLVETRTEDVDLTHNSKTGKAYRFKSKCSRFHVLEGEISGIGIVLKIAEKKTGKLIAYTLYTTQ